MIVFLYIPDHTSELTTALQASLILHTIIWRNGTLKHLYSEMNSKQGGKNSRKRTSVLLCTNLNGTAKLLPLFIRQYKSPRCFRNPNIICLSNTTKMQRLGCCVSFENVDDDVETSK
jgi:hypothetical protein